MQIDAARSAGAIAADIDDLTARVATLSRAVADGAMIADLRLTIVTDGNARDLIMGTQDVPDSAQAFNLGISILQTKIDALNQQLAGL